MKLQQFLQRDPTNHLNVTSIASQAVALKTTQIPATTTKSLLHYRTLMTTKRNNNNNNNESSEPIISTTSSSSIQRPNRFTSIYSKMQSTCYEEIENYAKCVISAQQQSQSERETAISTNNSGTTYQVCAAEFIPVKECFRTVRQQLRQQQQQQQQSQL